MSVEDLQPRIGGRRGSRVYDSVHACMGDGFCVS